MSVPEKHHFLPASYLERWATNGNVVRFVRPRGSDHPIHMKHVAPRAIAYERNLYAIPTAEDPAARQKLELDFYQRIDDRAAIALDKIDRNEDGSGEDRVAFAQFVLSLLVRNPAHLKHAREELRRRIGDLAKAPDIEDHLTSHVNLVVADMIQSSSSVQHLAAMKVFRIGTERASQKLLTSDRPTMLSRTLVGRDGFIVFPYGPDRLIVLANDEAVARAFCTQDANVLVKAVNDAIVLQAETVVIGADETARDFVEKRFLQPDRIAASAVDGNGMVRWKSPLTRLRVTRKSMLLAGTELGGASPVRGSYLYVPVWDGGNGEVIEKWNGRRD